MSSQSLFYSDFTAGSVSGASSGKVLMNAASRSRSSRVSSTRSARAREPFNPFSQQERESCRYAPRPDNFPVLSTRIPSGCGQHESVRVLKGLAGIPHRCAEGCVLPVLVSSVSSIFFPVKGAIHPSPNHSNHRRVCVFSCAPPYRDRGRILPERSCASFSFSLPRPGQDLLLHPRRCEVR